VGGTGTEAAAATCRVPGTEAAAATCRDAGTEAVAATCWDPAAATQGTAAATCPQDSARPGTAAGGTGTEEAAATCRQGAATAGSGCWDSRAPAQPAASYHFAPAAARVTNSPAAKEGSARGCGAWAWAGTSYGAWMAPSRGRGACSSRAGH
jgi:hypothetical protein